MISALQPVIPRIFVSHSHKDNDFVGILVQDLRRILGDDTAVWYDALGGLRGGDTWWSRIVEELTACDTYIIVLSRDAMNSIWVSRELNIAINERKRIVPVLYRTCDIRADLKTIQYTSFLPPKTYESAFNELVAVLRTPTFVEAKRVEAANLESDLVQKMTAEIEAAFDKNDWPDVVRKAEYLIKLVPGAVSPTIYRLQGLALFREGKLQQAQAALNTALALVGDRQQRLTLLNDCIDILALQGQWAEVLFYVDEALGLDPGNPSWLRTQKDARAMVQSSTVNHSHLNILKQGVVEWNEWRKKNSRIYPDLGGADLSKVDLSGANLSRVNLSKANLSEADLSHTDLSGASLSEANLSKANLRGADLSDASVNGTDLSEADLSGADLKGFDLRGVKLSGADLRDANFSGASLSEANLSKANLRDADLSDASVNGADLSEADLSGADLSKANLSRANLSGANLNGANLHGSLISFADISSASVQWTIFGDVDLGSVKGLDLVKHLGASTIGIDTIYRSQGAISETFLRSAGVPDDFITYMASLVGKPIEFYSCFISYSSRDSEFAQRLYSDLQSNNVRCWFAPESMKIGDIIRPRIDESIRLFDKLLLVLSNNSINSDWVEHEVAAVLSREQRQKRTVLFPITLDDIVMQTTRAWAADIRLTRHIGNFRSWKNYDDYQKAFTRLLRDLKAESG